jgi:serine/threonine protein kinase
MSPEVISARPYTSASDIWALGCVLYEAAARTPAFAAKGLPQVGLCGGWVGGWGAKCVRGLGVGGGQGEGAEE